MQRTALALLFLGCAGTIDPFADGKTDGISIPTWLRCSSTSGDKGVTVSCRTEPPSAPLVLGGASVRFTTPDGKNVALDLDDQKSGTVTLTGYPVHADFTLLALTRDDDAPGTLQSLMFHPLHGSFDFGTDGVEAAVLQPFQIWKLALTGSLAELRLPERALPFGSNLVDDHGQTSLEVDDSTLVTPGKTTAFYAVFTPDEAQLAVQIAAVDGSTGTLSSWSDAVITHPGAWTVDATGAHEGDVAGSDPVATPDLSAPPDLSPPAANPQLPDLSLPATTNPRPDCGNDGQLTCDDGTCNPGNTNVGNRCYVCGADGQYTCDDGSCNPGNWSDGSKCHACDPTTC